MEQIASNANFASLVAEGVAMVDFWATWCGPCRVLGPTVDDIAKEYEGKVTVVKCNVDDCEDIAVEYGIRNIPTLIFFKDGQPDLAHIKAWHDRIVRMNPELKGVTFEMIKKAFTDFN